MRILCCAGGTNKRKGGRPGDMGHHDEYGSGRFGGQLDREMQFFEKVKARLRSKEQYQVCQARLAPPLAGMTAVNAQGVCQANCRSRADALMPNIFCWSCYAET